MAGDPVCGMEVDEAKAPGKTEYKGQTYCFCAQGWKVSVEKDAERYPGKDTSED